MDFNIYNITAWGTNRDFKQFCIHFYEHSSRSPIIARAQAFDFYWGNYYGFMLLYTD